MNRPALLWLLLALTSRSALAEPCEETKAVPQAELEKILSDGSDPSAAAIAIGQFERSTDAKERCLRSLALQAAWRVREITDRDCAGLTPPNANDVPFDLPVAGEISRVKLTSMDKKLHYADGRPFTHLVHVGAPEYGKKRVLKLSLVARSFSIQYVRGCSSSEDTAQQQLGPGKPAPELGFEIVVPQAFVGPALKVDGHPWMKGYFAAPGEHIVTLEGRPECSARVSEASRSVEFPAACAPVTDPPQARGTTWLVSARADFVSSGLGNLVVEGGPSIGLGEGFRARFQAGGLFSTSARGFIGGPSLEYDIAKSVTLALFGEVFAASVDTVDSQSVWAFGLHPNVQARMAVIGGLGLYVAPGWFWLPNERLRSTSDASYWSIGAGIDWRSR
jgi:hypothetical protein